MSYRRVIPRDLFNEGNLLKCYGQLYMELEKLGMEDCLMVSTSIADHGFRVYQTSADGSTSLDNVFLVVRRERVRLSRPLNSREPFPLWLHTGDNEDYEFLVFDDRGRFTEAMRAFLTG